MRPGRISPRPTIRRQRGFALIAVLALAAMIAAFLIASALNRSSADVSNDRAQRNIEALTQAKAALIAYAANEQWQFYKNPPPPPSSNTGYFQPGALPSPDMDGDGDADFVWGANTASQIGRFPYKTVGADDLRDASGERLWYALSHDFRKIRCNPPPPAAQNPLGCTRINSDTRGQLTVVGATPATQVVAVLFAPGEALAGQNRPSNTASDYLEGPPDLSNAVNYVFTSQVAPSATFNDRLLVITQAELMAAVEPVVAAQIERDIVPDIQDYFTGWQAYPFPVQFDPTLTPSSAYLGDHNQTRGLLPLTTDTSQLRWDTSSITVTEIAGGTGAGAGSPPPAAPPYILDSPPDCSASTATQIICRVNYTGPSTDDRPKIRLRANLRRAGLSFPKPFGIADAYMTGSDGNPVEYNDSYPLGNFAYWSPVPPDPPFPYILPTVTHALSSSGDGTVVFTGLLQNNGPPPGGTGGRVTITITLAYEPFVQTSPVGWFVANEWYRQTYYAVAQGFLPPGGGGCSPAPCLSVSNLRPSYANPYSAQAILLLAGRSLNGNSRPSTILPDYFENANLSSAQNPLTQFAFENRSGLPTSINDRVVVVSP